MGYHTYYNLIITSSDKSELSKEKEREIIAELRGEGPPDGDPTDAWFAFDDEGNAQMDTTWNDVDEDMKEFSKKYPDLVFEIAGTGDASDDLWSTYYKNGKMQHCPVEFIYPPYDESKLV